MMQQRADEKKERKKKNQPKAFDNDREEVVVSDTRNEVKWQRSSQPTGSW